MLGEKEKFRLGPVTTTVVQIMNKIIMCTNNEISILSLSAPVVKAFVLFRSDPRYFQANRRLERRQLERMWNFHQGNLQNLSTEHFTSLD